MVMSRKNNLSNTFTTMGSSKHSKTKRSENDFYSTDPSAISMLEKYGLLSDEKYWECACGNGNLSKKLESLGYDVYSSDLYDRGYGESGIDFLKCNKRFNGNILTNPPFSQVDDFLVKGIELAEKRLYIFGRIQVLESMKRWQRVFSKNKPTYVCPFVKRIKCYPNNKPMKYGSAISYAWFIWDKENESNNTYVKWLV